MPRKRTAKSAETPPQSLPGLGPDPLDLFLPIVADWFRTRIGQPTDAQARGWPLIHAGKNTLILAPTGSGKTLAAFMAGLDYLWRQEKLVEGVQILYISPLKALNEDIHRNLDFPLAGVARLASENGIRLPEIKTAVRTGDTSTNDRQAQIRRPPHVLITTPESLHLILGGRARSMLQNLKFVIVDELHALAGQKRGTFLAILLERLVEELGREFIRVGLTATVNPVEEAAAFLGGYTADDTKNHSEKKRKTLGFHPRPVSIVKSIVPKVWDLQVSRAEIDPDPQQPRSIWPSLEKELFQLIDSHQSTLVFANNRYLVERLAAHINELDSDRREVTQDQDTTEQDAKVNQKSDVEDDQVDQAPIDSLVHAHHGSISLERRRQTESMLKVGSLKGVISTASLEMGIDMGAVDLVCQIGSPGEVARGLQRVGRAGHAVGAVSKGRFFARTNADLLETAALVEAMSRAAVEPLAIPQNCLDMLAQQIVACVAVRPYKPRRLYELFQRTYTYRYLSEKAFEAVLDMVSGRFRVEAIRDLRARLYWDRLRDEVVALPGTSSLALTGGGSIPDTGQYPVKLGESGPTLGSLDEEFVLERRAGESFRLGSSTWRIDRIEADKVLVSPANSGEMIVMPFWRGEESRRSATLGAAIGGLVRKIAETEDYHAVIDNLMNTCRLDHESAHDLAKFVRRQLRLTGAVPDDHTIIVEAFADPTGEVALAILSPWGGRVHQALKIVLQSRLFDRLGIRPAAQHCDDGLIMRLPRHDDIDPPMNLLDDLTYEEASERLKSDLADSALFGLRFRQNAARALLLPRPDPGKRTPLWLQRLRAKDLLQVVRQMPDFPIVLECYRECLSQDLDLVLLKRLLDDIASGQIRVVKHQGESASPFAADLMNRFERKFLYEWDEPQKSRENRDRIALAESTPGEVLEELLDPSIISRIELQKAGEWLRPVRSAEELAERLSRVGDLAENEITSENATYLKQLADRGLATQIFENNKIWIASEEMETYQSAFPAGFSARKKVSGSARNEAMDQVLSRFVKARTLISLNDIVNRYPIETAMAADWLGRWTESGGFVRVPASPETGQPARWADSRNMQQILGSSLAQRRREIKPLSPDSWAGWVIHRHFRTQNKIRANGIEQLSSIMLELQGWPATLRQWEEEIIAFRLRGLHLTDFDRLLATGEWRWQIAGDETMNLENPEISFWHSAFPDIGKRSEKVQLQPDPAMNQMLESLKQFPARSAELASKFNLQMPKVNDLLQKLLMNHYITNEKVAFLHRWLSGKSGLNSELKSPESSGTRASTRSTAQRRVNKFRELLTQQGVGGGGRGLGARSVVTDSIAMEGRWQFIEKHESVSDDDYYAAWSALLIARYGVVCREVVKFAAHSVDWPAFSQWLEAAEWRGELRRGYFVEGLSGLQFTDESTMQEFAIWQNELNGDAPAGKFQLLSAIDPLNLYGASAPLDLPLLESGRARLPRIPGNMIVFCAGRPVWIVQERGARLTVIPHSDELVQRESLQFLVEKFTFNSTKWTIETIDGDASAKSLWAKDLVELGFFRDGLNLTRYRGLM